MGTCQVYNSPNGQPSPPLTPLAGLNVGPQITVQGPNGSKTASGSGGDYRTTLRSTGNYFAPGAITVSAPGGTDVPSFSATIAVPALPTMTSPVPDSVNPISVTRSNGLTVTWSEAGPHARWREQASGGDRERLASVPAAAAAGLPETGDRAEKGPLVTGFRRGAAGSSVGRRKRPHHPFFMKFRGAQALPAGFACIWAKSAARWSRPALYVLIYTGFVVWHGACPA